jgi:hypothetical protein
MDGLMIYRKIATFGAAATLAFSGMPAVADDYRAEVRLSGQHFDLDDASEDIDVFGATGTYYLEPVRTDGLPLAEAAFLGRSSYASVNATRIDFGDDVTALSANLGYYVPNTIFFGRLGYSHVDFGPGNERTFDGTFGVTPFDGLLLTTDFDEDGWDPNIAAKYVGKLANAHYYAITASAVDPDGGDTAVGLDFDYFLDLTLKVGGGFNSGDDRFTIRAEKFFTPSFAVGGSLFTGDDANGLGATVAWRF